MGDTTPNHKHPTEELPALDLLMYRLRQVEKNGDKAIETTEKILSLIGDMSRDLVVGNERFKAIEKISADHEARILGAENDKRGITGIATGLAAAVAAIGAYFTK